MFRGNTDQLKNAIGEMSVRSRTHRDRSISDAALSYIVELECSMNWQPIETWNSDIHDCEILVGCCVYGYDKPPRWSAWPVEPIKMLRHWEFGNDGELGDTPTHWMPLPASPKDTK